MSNADNKDEIIKVNTDIKKIDEIKADLPANKTFGNNSDGYAIIPNEGK